MRVQRAHYEEEGYDPIKEAVDRKASHKPADDLYSKKPRYLNPPLSTIEDHNIQRINLALFSFLDVVTKKPVGNVYVRVMDEGNNRLYSYRSNSEGVCKVMLKTTIQRGRISIEHSEYYDKFEQLTEQRQLSSSKTNVFLLIKRPPHGSITLLIQNTLAARKVNFYVLAVNSIPCEESDIVDQYYNEEDGVQYLSFHDLQEQKGAIQIVACLPDTQIGIESVKLLLPTRMEVIAIPKIIVMDGILPYFWVVGSMSEPYERFDSLGRVIDAQNFTQLP